MAYKYSGPHDWLFTKAQTWNETELHSALLALAERLDADAIQDLFQTEMAQDGYFDKAGE